MEIFQMAMLSPRLLILDETDSGLDIDALRIVAEGVNAMRASDRAMLVITHYQRLLDYIKPDRVHVLAGGRIVASGGAGTGARAGARGLRAAPRGRRVNSRRPPSRPAMSPNCPAGATRTGEKLARTPARPAARHPAGLAAGRCGSRHARPVRRVGGCRVGLPEWPRAHGVCAGHTGARRASNGRSEVCLTSIGYGSPFRL